MNHELDSASHRCATGVLQGRGQVGWVAVEAAPGVPAADARPQRGGRLLPGKAHCGEGRAGRERKRRRRQAADRSTGALASAATAFRYVQSVGAAAVSAGI